MSRNLVKWQVAVVVVFGIFMIMPDKTAERFDPYIVGLIGVTLFLSGIVMWVYTEKWTTRALAVLSLLFGTGVIYSGSLVFYLRPELVMDNKEWVTSLGRSLLVIGGVMMLAALFMYVKNQTSREPREFVIDDEGKEK